MLPKPGVTIQYPITELKINEHDFVKVKGSESFLYVVPGNERTNE
jgi:hypothetical protein